MKTACSVLMLDGDGDIALSVARCLAQEPSIQLHVLSQRFWAPLVFSRSRASCHVMGKAKSAEQTLEIIHHTVHRTGAEVLLPVTEAAIRFVSAHRGRMPPGLALMPVPEVRDIDTASDKWSLSRHLAQQQLPQPVTKLLTSDRQNLEGLTFPVLLKPTRGMGGEGIIYCPDLAAFRAYARQVLATGRPYLVQDYLEGYDLDCSVLCREGKILAYTMQTGFLPNAKPFLRPAGIQFVKDDHTLLIVTQLMASLNWSGVAHVDLRYNQCDGQVKVLEVNARYWGSLLGSLKAGVNFPHWACKAARGESFAVPDYRLIRFVDVRAVMGRRWAWRRNHTGVPLSLRETGWQTALADPLAEMVSWARQGWYGVKRIVSKA